MEIVRLDEVDSTNSYLERRAPELDDTVLVCARRQTAGRGQRGNSWESAPGQNLTFSLLFHPVDFRPALQFAISEATALAVVDFLARHSIRAKVKWPNDIYVGDRKICGILIKHSLMGSQIAYSILGVGINVNQTLFVSDAPNPVSMKQLTGESFDPDALLDEIAECLESRLRFIYGEGRQRLHEEYKECLWRGDGRLHPFRDSGSGVAFSARIEDIGADGVMTLACAGGDVRRYRFKEVAFILRTDTPRE